MLVESDPASEVSAIHRSKNSEFCPPDERVQSLRAPNVLYEEERNPRCHEVIGGGHNQDKLMNPWTRVNHDTNQFTDHTSSGFVFLDPASEYICTLRQRCFALICSSLIKGGWNEVNSEGGVWMMIGGLFETGMRRRTSWKNQLPVSIAVSFWVKSVGVRILHNPRELVLFQVRLGFPNCTTTFSLTTFSRTSSRGVWHNSNAYCLTDQVWLNHLH